ncbi:Nse4-domain-containing protein [Lepidopterella palustris CBS 459.81]|uniref:Non-structural maintenance of chromosomes element 4 n=1 Tax=Lepidopterella palustris CBS 459.81 TaxID=1314670 RepID=A0A8E2EFA8_9PEZI|nr:Nse4-domain-containing protein [Lepidopterella palustris CBS 459.81]
MARLNIAPDSTPIQDFHSSTRASTYSVMSLSPAPSSDKENQPDQRDQNRREKGSMAPPLLSDSTSRQSSNGNKRRRLGDYSISPEWPTLVDEATELNDVDMADLEFYDPNQDGVERREVRGALRQNHRDMNDRKDELVHPDNHDLIGHIDQSSVLMKRVRQTADAVIDSRFLVSASDLALKKTNNTVRGDNAAGVDLDEFVSKCITFMRTRGYQENTDRVPHSTLVRRQRRREGADSEDEEFDGEGDGLDWATLGSRACFPTNTRPPVSSFLLGPLSVQKRVRASQPRRGRQTQDNSRATRPESLEPEDLEKVESSNLTHVVKDIRVKMKSHIETAMKRVDTELPDDADEDSFYAALGSHRVSVNEENEAAVSLFDFVVNPYSFGQTVENLFYVSFLIKEGHAKVEKDRDGLPILSPSDPRKVSEHQAQGISKHQAVFSIDWPMWQNLVKAFDIKEPLIPHRNDDKGTAVTARGWYG